MKKLFCAFVLAGVTAVAAHAADIPTKAPFYEAPPAYIWSGFYLGGNVGGALQRLDNSLSITNDPANGFFGSAAIPGVNASGSPELNASNVTLGGQFGFNKQVQNIVYGAEVDFNWLNLKKDAGGTFVFATNNAPYVLTTSEKAQWLFTARPRLGWAADRLLFYVTGGLAVTKIKFGQAYGEPALDFAVRDVAPATKTKIGWTAGLGGEWALRSAWTVKAEYLYTQFNATDITGQVTSSLDGSSATFSNSLSPLKIHAARVGVNYRFGMH